MSYNIGIDHHNNILSRRRLSVVVFNKIILGFFKCALSVFAIGDCIRIRTIYILLYKRASACDGEHRLCRSSFNIAYLSYSTLHRRPSLWCILWRTYLTSFSYDYNIQVLTVVNFVTMSCLLYLYTGVSIL